MAQQRTYMGSSGTATAAIGFGGVHPATTYNVTEEFTGATTAETGSTIDFD